MTDFFLCPVETRVMGVRGLLLTACILGCIFRTHCLTNQPDIRFFGDLPVMRIFDSSKTVNERSTETPEKLPDSDRVFHEIEDAFKEAYEVITCYHPDVTNVIHKVFKEILTLAANRSAFTTEDCLPEYKLVDIIINSAREIRKEYEESCNNCDYHPYGGCTQFWGDPKIPATCPKVTKQPETSTVETRPTEKPCPEKPSTSTVETRPSEKPCPEKASTTEKPITKEPESTTPEDQPADEPCLNKTSTGKTQTPCPEIASESDAEVEVVTEEYDQLPPLIGSVRGLPGIHYPNYTDIPITSFSCADKYIPGFYADLETGCQVFHVCYEHRRESFLCPVGTVFNQPILACDYWYSTNCSISLAYYEDNAKPERDVIDIEGPDTELPEEEVLKGIAQFLPVKARVIEVPSPEEKVVKEKPQTRIVEDVASDIFDKMISTAAGVTSKIRDAIGKLPEPDESKFKSKVPAFKTKLPQSKTLPVFKVKPLAKAKSAVAPSIVAKGKLAAVKAKVAGAAIPVAATKAKVAAAVPIVGKVKVAAAIPKVVAKATIPALKAKLMASAVPLAKAKLAAPVMKGKAIKAATVPLAKAKFAAPVLKGKAVKAAAVPLLKAKALGGSAPFVKAKLAKAAVISPLTKKALALGYMKLLKAKKLALMG